MTVYIAGGITGVENYKPLRGREAAAAAGGRGPADQHGALLVLNPAELPEGWPNGLYMDVCLAMIRAADLVVFLPGWERSRGASLEMQYSRYEGKPVYKIAAEELEAWREE